MRIALTLILFAFAILLAEGVAMLERRVDYFAGTRG